MDNGAERADTRRMERGTAPRSVGFATWLLFVGAGIWLIDCVVPLVRGGSYTWVLVGWSLSLAAANLLAAIGVRRARAWGWLLGMLLAGLGIYTGIVLTQAMFGLPFGRAYLLSPILRMGGTGVALALSLSWPSSVRWCWPRWVTRSAAGGSRPDAWHKLWI